MQQKITELLKHWNLSAWQWNLILIGASIALGVIIFFLLKLLAWRKAQTTHRFLLFHSLGTHLSFALSIFLPLFFLNILLPAFKGDKTILHKVSKTVELGLIISFAWILIQIIKVIQDWVYVQYDINKANNLQARKVRTQLQYVRRITVTMIIVITAAMVLLSFKNLQTLGSSLLTGVGLGGIIIGFAAQKSLANYLAGFQIAFTQPFRIDDVLIVEGEFGRVDEITLTYVVLKLWDERRLVLPINYFIEKPFQNWSRINTELLGTVEIYTDYSVPVQEVRNELTRLLNQHTLWDKKAMALQVTDAKQGSIVLRALMSATNAGELFTLRCDIREALIKFINENYPESLPKIRAELKSNDEPAA